jgi:hypothetical protein
MTIEAIDLLGDSIYDNQSYVEQGDSVIDQISAISPVHVALHAVDGHTTTDCRLVLEDLGNDPKPTTGACISIGGNDALQNASILLEPCSNVLGAITKMQTILDEFRIHYCAVLEKLLRIYERENIRVCTVYNKIPVSHMPREAMTALGMFNEIITEEVNRRDLQLLDLRVICDSADCYSPVSPIEPSKEGGRRIVQAILNSFKEV